MIVILGDTHDDILYFDSVLANKKQEVLMNRYKVSIGTIFSQEVIVVHEMVTSVLTSAVLSHILDKYYIDLVISVGRCVSVSRRYKNGDIALSSKVVDINVDLTLFKDVGLSQIPGFDREFMVQDDILGYVATSLEKRERIDYHKVTFLSSDNLSKDIQRYLTEHNSIFADRDDSFVIDHNSSGVAVASTLRSVPFIVVKVIENKIDQSSSLDSYTKVLSSYIDLGKAVITTINNIGRSDILEED